jgi:type I restriction enzyme S subunit
MNAKMNNAQALRQSILRQAFSGKLVPQETSDEPACELLKRIAAQREQRDREAANAKRLPQSKPHNLAKASRKMARKLTKETDNGRIADR